MTQVYVANFSDAATAMPLEKFDYLIAEGVTVEKKAAEISRPFVFNIEKASIVPTDDR